MLLDDPDTLDLSRGCDAGRASIPEDTPAFMGARVTALAKPDGGVRATATGSFFKDVGGPHSCETCCGRVCTHVFQYTLSTGARTNCVGQLLRAVSDSNHE